MKDNCMLEQLYEELKDMNKSPLNVHWTNPIGLLGMLDSGFIKGDPYEDDTTLAPKKGEVATIRRSEDKRISSLRGREKEYKDSLLGLSSSINGVKIYLFTDRIKSAVRGVKKYPISEYGVRERSIVKKSTDMLYEFYTDFSKGNIDKKEFSKVFSRKVDEFAREVAKKKKPTFSNEELNKVIAYLNKKFGVEKEMFKGYRDSLEKAIFASDGLSSGKTREGEERFTYDNEKSKGIPMKPEFMKIRFMNVLDNYKSHYKKLAQYMKLDEKMFVKDKNYTKIMEIANEEGFK